MAGLSRRRFLHTAGGAALLGGATGVLSACAGADDRPSVDVATAAVASDPHYLEPLGIHQVGVVATHQAEGLLAAFDVHARDRDELRATFESLTGEIRRLMRGTPYEERDPDFPPLHTGTVGNPPPPSELSVVVSVGASLFDGRYGLADRRPAELERMPFLANDRLDPARSHGDVLLSVASADREVTLFALRQLMRATRGNLGLHWLLEGYQRRTEADPGEAGVRNLMGFVDGTANLDPSDDDLMDRLVWVAPGDGEPAWAAGGTYQVVRVIRMFVEFWDRTRLREQEALIGRRKATGAPLDGEVETDVPDYAADPEGEVTPLDAHIRLANPRTPGTEDQRILRKGLSYSRGFDGDGQLDQGLAFVSYQRSLERQFLPVQERLAGEPLEEYLLPEGGGFFFVLPGTPDEKGFLGEGLFR